MRLEAISRLRGRRAARGRDSEGPARVAALLATICPAVPCRAAEPAPAFAFSPDPAVAAGQRGAYDAVHRYETLLNAGDTAGILDLFAPDGVAEWNDRPTFATREEHRAAYEALFKVAKFSTVFGDAGIDVSGDTAVVRSFHHRGATVLEGGKGVVDLNREVFVLERIDGARKIRLYTFNTDPVQGGKLEPVGREGRRGPRGGGRRAPHGTGVVSAGRR